MFFNLNAEMGRAKLTIKKLSEININCMFEGENNNIPVVTFEVEFWDEVKKEDNSEIMKNMEMRQEVGN